MKRIVGMLALIVGMFALIVGICLIAVMAYDAGTTSASNHDREQRRAPIVDGRKASASIPSSAPINIPAARTETTISVDSSSLLSEYQANEEAANARYEDREVTITGVLSGVFVPSIDVALRMAAKGYKADAFVTMGGPQPSSPGEAALLPGITAYSENGSLFGLKDVTAVTNPLRIGETVTLVCTCGKGYRAIASPNGTSGYSILMEKCLLRNDSASEDRPRESENRDPQLF